MSDWRLTYLHQRPREFIWHIRQELDKALKRLTDERASRPLHGLKGYYPNDRRVVPEMSENLYPIKAAMDCCATQIAHLEGLIAEYKEHHECLGAMDYLFQREIDIAMCRRKP